MSLQRNVEGRSFGVGVDACSLRSYCRQGLKPASRPLRSCLSPATVLSSGSWRSPFLRCAQFRFYEFSLVLEVMPPQKNRSASPAARNFVARIKERPCGVSFECCFNLLPLERSASVNSSKYIGMDVHTATISVAVRDAAGKLIMESVIETKASTILQFIRGLRRD